MGIDWMMWMKKIGILCLVGILLSGCFSPEPESNKGSLKGSMELIGNSFLSNIRIEEQPKMELLQVEFEERDQKFQSVFFINAENISFSSKNDFIDRIITVENWDQNGKMSYNTREVEFLDGYTYEISFEVSSDIVNRGSAIIKTYEEEIWRNDFSITQEKQEVTFNYTHHRANMTEDIFCLELFNDQNLTQGTIEIKNLRVRCLEETKLSVSVNQQGYLPDLQKTAIFKYNSGDGFYVINTETNEIVYKGLLVNEKENADTKEKNYVGDFTELKTPGKYRIETQINGQSLDFVIQEGIYLDLFNSSLKMLTLQRCGQDLFNLDSGAFEHEACHKQIAHKFGSNEEKDVSGGWHDAGDYGRYTLTAVKTINDLLMAYYVYPDSYSDNMIGISSGNGISDVLDEAFVGLDWLLKMQQDWGPVYNAAVTPRFADTIDPQEDEQEILLLKEENTATAVSAGSWAFAAMLIKDVDANRSKIYEEAAIKAYQYALSVRGGADIPNPSTISAGDYLNSSDRDEIYFASAALYVLTHDESYLNEISNMIENYPNELCQFTYSDFGGYGSFLLLKDEVFKKNHQELYSLLYDKFMNEALYLVKKQRNDGYQVAVYSYLWGGNMYVANYAMVMLLANDLDPHQEFVDCAFEQLSYLLGKNSLNKSFITGYGIDYPRNIHHRIAQLHDAELKGALVGGPDDHAENSDTAPAKKYWDDSEKYSTNEVAIYFNSVLNFILGEFAKR